MDLLKDHRLANNISVVMLNPVNYSSTDSNDDRDHKRLKSLPLYVLPTCNTFKKADVLDVLKSIYNHFYDALRELGSDYRFNLCGFASDGDKRRVAIQDNVGRVTAEQRESGKSNKYWLPHELLGYSGTIIPNPIRYAVNL